MHVSRCQLPLILGFLLTLCHGVLATADKPWHGNIAAMGDVDWGDSKKDGKWWGAYYQHRETSVGGPVRPDAIAQAWQKLRAWCDKGGWVKREEDWGRHFEYSDNPTGAMAYVCTWKGPQQCKTPEMEELWTLMSKDLPAAEKNMTKECEWAWCICMRAGAKADTGTGSVRVNLWAKGYGVVETSPRNNDESFACGFPDKIRASEIPSE